MIFIYVSKRKKPKFSPHVTSPLHDRLLFIDSTSSDTIYHGFTSVYVYKQA